MITGYLQKKKDMFYVVLHLNDAEGKLKKKWISTGLHVKGNKKKAEALLFEIKKEYDVNPKSVPLKESTVLFSDFLLTWLEIVKGQVEAITYQSYSNNLKSVAAPYFAERQITLQDLSPKDIQEFYQFLLTKRSISANSVLHYHANIHKALKYAVKRELITMNPADKVDRPKKEEFIGTFYNTAEIEKLFEVTKNTQLEFPVKMASFYGLRRSEIVGLRWQAIDFDCKTITIEHTINVLHGGHLVAKDRTKNKSSRRTLPLIPEVEELLRCMKRDQEDYRRLCKSSYCKDFKDYVYVNSLGKLISPDYITRKFHDVIQKYGLRKIRFHDLRHTCASLLLANGVDMKEIQEWLGHSNYSTTANIYTHLDYSSKVSSANTMQKLFSFNSEPSSSSN